MLDRTTARELVKTLIRPSVTEFFESLTDDTKLWLIELFETQFSQKCNSIIDNSIEEYTAYILYGDIVRSKGNFSQFLMQNLNFNEPTKLELNSIQSEILEWDLWFFSLSPEARVKFIN